MQGNSGYVWNRGACILSVRFHMYMYKPSFLSSAGLKGSIGFDTMLVSVMGRDTYQPSLQFSQWGAKQYTTTTTTISGKA